MDTNYPIACRWYDYWRAQQATHQTDYGAMCVQFWYNEMERIYEQASQKETH
jgi:hypothetical protein